MEQWTREAAIEASRRDVAASIRTLNAAAGTRENRRARSSLAEARGLLHYRETRLRERHDAGLSY